MDISRVDKNFTVETDIIRDGLEFFDIKNEPFSVCGVFYENGAWVRLPRAVAETVNEGVAALYEHTAGGRVRFVTDSPYIVIKAVQVGKPGFAHMATSGVSGFDLYETAEGKYIHRKTFMPEINSVTGLEGVFDFSSEGERILTLDFPLYFNVKELYIGIKSGSVLKKAPDYKIKKPIVFYGSSITQGGCASRAGTSYQGFLSRKYDADYINLGFSGSARGEENMANYIASLDMSAFVYDYDHNAPTEEHLRNTHERFYKIIRAAHPDIPVIIMTRPKVALRNSEKIYRDIIYQTYKSALDRGEKVYFAVGSELMQLCADEGTVDGCHPTDLGFFSMAERLSVEFDKFIDTLV